MLLPNFIFLSLNFKGVSWKYINVLSVKSFFFALQNDFKAVVERKLRMRGQEIMNEILFVTTAIQK